MAILERPPGHRLLQLVDALGGTWHGRRAMCRCPAHADRTPSLSLRQGDRDILVTCFAGCAPEDVLRELANVTPTGKELQEPLERHSRSGNVERLWNEAFPVAGTIAERYLAGRHLPIGTDMRFHPRCPQGPSPNTKFKPALLIGVREGRKLVAIQRIFIDPVLGWYTEKRTLGSLGAGAWQGGGLAPRIGLAEGFETAAAYSRLKNLPCWSPLGAARFDLVDLPDSVVELVIAGDNDAEGRRAVRKAIRRYTSAARIVRVDYPPAGYGDWADALDAICKSAAAKGAESIRSLAARP